MGGRSRLKNHAMKIAIATIITIRPIDIPILVLLSLLAVGGSAAAAMAMSRIREVILGSKRAYLLAGREIFNLPSGS